MKKWLLFFFFLFVISCDDLEKDNFSENGKIILEENQRKNEADNTITVKDYDSSAEYFVETDKMKISNLLSKILGIPIKEIKLSDTSIKFPISENKNETNKMIKMVYYKYKNFYIYFEISNSNYITCYTIVSDKSKVSYDEFQEMIEKFILIGIDEKDYIDTKIITKKLFSESYSEISYKNNLYLFLENDKYNFAVIKIPDGVERINPVKQMYKGAL